MANREIEDRIRAALRAFPDFPKPGVIFQDMTPILASADLFADVTTTLAAGVATTNPDGIVAIEARGFLFGAAVAQSMRLPLLLARKPGKLPGARAVATYALEYGEDALEMHQSLGPVRGRLAIIDDVLATGGTATAAARLVEEVGAQVAAWAFVLEIGALGGRDRLTGAPVTALTSLR